jgi:hypothetical protein
MGKHHKYTPEEMQFIRDNITGRSYAEFTEMFNRRFGCSLSTVALEQKIIKNCRLSNGLSSGNFFRIKPVGTELIKPDGYIIVKTNPGSWKRKHRIIWEAANGPIPKDCAVIFADGDKSNFNLDNLLLVSTKELGIMNRFGLIVPDKDLTRAGKMVAAIKLLINERSGTRRKRKKEANTHAG